MYPVDIPETVELAKIPCLDQSQTSGSLLTVYSLLGRTAQTSLNHFYSAFKFRGYLALQVRMCKAFLFHMCSIS